MTSFWDRLGPNYYATHHCVTSLHVTIIITQYSVLLRSTTTWYISMWQNNNGFIACFYVTWHTGTLWQNTTIMCCYVVRHITQYHYATVYHYTTLCQMPSRGIMLNLCYMIHHYVTLPGMLFGPWSPSWGNVICVPGFQPFLTVIVRILSLMLEVWPSSFITWVLCKSQI